MVKGSPQRGEQAVAVVGMACRVPDAEDYSSFWCNLTAGKVSVKDISTQRRFLSGLDKEIFETNRCACIEGIDLFDHDFFRLSRREVESMDPQQRLFLEEAYHCIEDSGVAMDTLRRRVTSVYLGVTGSDYSLLAFNRGGDIDSHAALGNMQCLAANRISYQLGFRGISLSLDAATASSLVAVHEAKKSLCLGESDFALAGAVNLAFHPWRYTAFEKAGMLSSDGQCKPFDSHANGFVYGEGVAILLLQRLECALRDCNHVYGIIHGSAINHCGHAHTITAPKVSAQRDAILAAWEEAGFNLETAGYIEAHGSGTAVGDPIEIEALSQAFARHTSRKGFCKIGSVKSNIGHLFSASGLAGLIKVLLMMRHHRVPKTQNVEQLNPLIDFTASPFLPALEEAEWTATKDTIPRRAGISAIGLGGVNAHVVLEEYYRESTDTTTDSTASSRALPFLLSAKTSVALQAILDRWTAFTDSEEFDRIPFSDLCHTLATGRESLPFRLGFCLSSKSELSRIIERLRSESTVESAAGWSLHLTGFTPAAAAFVAKAGLRYELFRRYFTEISQAVAKVEPSVSMWKKSDDSVPGPVFAYVVEFTCLRFLLTLGMAPRLLSASGTGLWAVLSACGILSTSDATALLSGRCRWQEVKLSRPQTIPFYDPVGQGLIAPLRFDENYLTSLIEDIWISPALMSELVHKARLLIDSQTTFMRYMDEWRRESKIAGLDLDALLNYWRPKQEGYTFASHDSLLALMIASTLCKLCRRWELSDPLPQYDSGFREMVELVVDDILSPSAVIKLFSHGVEAVEIAASTLSNIQAVKTAPGAYARLRNHCQAVGEIENLGAWLQLALANSKPPDVAPGIAQLELGAKVMLRHERQQDEVFEIAHLAHDAGFITLLVGLWRHGMDLDWGKLYPEGSFAKVPLPCYPFQREGHWLPPHNAKEDEGRSEAADNSLSLPKTQNLTETELSKTSIQSYLRELFANELRLPSAHLDEDKAFTELGVTSIMVAALVKRIEARLGGKLDPSVILAYPTIARLSVYLANYHSGTAMSHRHAPPDQLGADVRLPQDKRSNGMPQMGNPQDCAAKQIQTADISGKVAVIGIACHFPEASNKNQFWKNLAAGRNSIVEVPKQRWDISRYYSATHEKNKSVSKWGGFIQGIEYFDPEYYGLNVGVALHIDPLIRQFLECAVQTFTDAGYDKTDLAGQRVGVFVGSRVSNYRNRISSLLPDTVLGVDQNFIASHVSHLFDLRGPNLVLDSACSSSLMSIHAACHSLKMGDCEMALAGGVDILLDERQYLLFSESQALSPDGRCFTFDERANGFVPGEGSGAILLKPLVDAIRDGDKIYAIVDGSAANNDGRTMGVTTPNPDAQRDVIARALQQAQVSAADISYIEAHGTGTMIGDPIELRALTDIFREATDDRNFCGVGSVKTNIGHLLCAAGVAGFIKVALSLQHKQIPPTLNCEYPNPRFDFETSPFYPNIRLSEWRPRNGSCRAGISSFGFAGTNVHVILSEFDPERYSLHYHQRRRSLPPVQFNKRRFWIDEERGSCSDSCGLKETPQDGIYGSVKPFMELIEEAL